MRMQQALMVAGFGLGLMSGSAQAELLHFDFRDPYEPLSFNLNSMPAPSASDDEGFTVRASIAAVYHGRPVPYFDLVFLTSAAGGGFVNNYFPSGPLGEVVSGDQLFSNDTTHPVFSPGSFTLVDPGSGSSEKLVISAVPLPSSAPMLGAALLGLAGLGYAAKRKKAAPAA